MEFVAALKWVDTSASTDPLTGEVTTDDRTRALSPADEAALELCLRTAEERRATVTVVTVGPAGAASMLRSALAIGADRAILIPNDDADLESVQVARALASAVGAADAVFCGDWSLDRGSGTVPGLLAGALGVAQALGSTSVEVDGAGLRCERRLDRGWRERLSVPLPAVVSVEGAAANLRRASLPALLAARNAAVEVRDDLDLGAPRLTPGTRRPFRPRARVTPAPIGESARSRILALTGATIERTPPRRVVADPDEAAAVVLDQLRAWGYVE